MVLDFRVFERSDLSFTLASQQDRRRKNPFNPKQKGRGAGGRVVRREIMVHTRRGSGCSLCIIKLLKSRGPRHDASTSLGRKGHSDLLSLALRSDTTELVSGNAMFTFKAVSKVSLFQTVKCDIYLYSTHFHF